jgi:hypothetical protein
MNWLSNKILSAESTLKTVITASVTSKRPEEENGLENGGINADLIEFVRNISEHPKTFLDFPLDDRTDIQNHFFTIFFFNLSQELSGWQVTHAKRILEAVPELGELRFKLCPSSLSERKFWTIYFLLVKRKLSNIPAPEEKPSILSVYDFSATSPFSSPNSKGSDIEEYYDSLWKEQMNHSANFDEGIDPTSDNYFYVGTELSFEEDPEQEET